MTSILLYYHMKQTTSLSVEAPKGSPPLGCSLVLTCEHMLEALGGSFHTHSQSLYQGVWGLQSTHFQFMPGTSLRGPVNLVNLALAFLGEVRMGHDGTLGRLWLIHMTAL